MSFGTDKNLPMWPKPTPCKRPHLARTPSGPMRCSWVGLGHIEPFRDTGETGGAL